MTTTLHRIEINANTILMDHEVVFAGEGDYDTFLKNAYTHLGINYPKFYKMDIYSKIGFLGAECLLKNNSFEASSRYKKGMVFQNISASLVTDKKYQESNKGFASPALFVYTLPNIVMGEIAIRHQFKGENTFFVLEQYDQKQCYEYASLLLNEGILEVCLMGFIEPGSVKMALLTKHPE